MKHYSHYQLVFLLFSFVVSFACGLDAYIPLIPQMTEIFKTTPALVQLTMSLFMLAIAIGQLVLGPLSDQFGRKPLLIYSSILFSLGSFACIFSTHIYFLISMRIISGFGACGMLVTSFAIVRDLLSQKESAKMYSFLNGAIGISPTFAPILGGYVSIYAGWKGVFVLLAILGMYSSFIGSFFIKETLIASQRIKINKTIFERYLYIYKDRQFLTFALIAGFSQAVFFGFFSISPFIIIDLHQIPVEFFGYYFALFGLVLSLGGLISGKFIDQFGLIYTFQTGIFLMLIGGISMVFFTIFFPLNLFGFLVPMAISCTGAMFLVGSSASSAMENFSSIAGTAAAAFGSLEFGICALIGSSLMLFPVNSTLPYALCILLMTFFCSCLWFSHKSSSLLKSPAD